MLTRPYTTVRFDDRRQKAKIRKAAERRRLSMNQYMIEAAERMEAQEHLERVLASRPMTHDEIVDRLIKREDPLVIDKWVEYSQEDRFGSRPILQQTQTLGETLVPKANNSPSSAQLEQHQLLSRLMANKEEL